MTDVLEGSRWHKRVTGTLRHRIVLRKLDHNEATPFVVHTQIETDNGNLCYEQGDYFQRIKDAIGRFVERSDRFESAYRSVLED